MQCWSLYGGVEKRRAPVPEILIIIIVYSPSHGTAGLVYKILDSTVLQFCIKFYAVPVHKKYE